MRVITGGAQANRKSPPAPFSFRKHRTTAPIAALSMVETADKSRIKRLCFSCISESTSCSSCVHSAPQCTLPAIAIAVIPSPISFLLSCMARSSLLSQGSRRNGFVGRAARQPGRRIRAAGQVLGLRTRGKSHGRFAHTREIRNEFIQLGKFQAVIHHRL